MPDLARQTAPQRANYHYMADAMRRLEWDLHNAIEATGRIPPEWHDIAQTRGPRRKTRISFWVEEDVLKFFKSMGTGHTTRMAEVLRSYMHARLAGVIRGAETVSYYQRRDGLHDGERPLWGETARDMGEGAEASEAEMVAEMKARLREELRRRQAGE